MFMKSVSIFTAFCLTFSSLVVTGWAKDEEEDDGPQAIRMIAPQGDEGWAIVDVRTIEGKTVVVSPVVGSEISFEEKNRFGIFNGPNEFNRRIDIPILKIGVTGFQSAMFMKHENGRISLKVDYSSFGKKESRMIRIRDEDDLRKIREYLEHFSEIQKGEYTISKTSEELEEAEFPKFTDDKISFEERRMRFPIRFRTRGKIYLNDGEEVEGELLPVYEDEQLLIETDLDTRRVSVAQIERLRFLGERGSAAMERALLSGLGGVATGALTGALAAWQADADVKRVALWAGIIFGGIGFVTGLLTGARSTRGSEDYVLGPVSPNDRRGNRD